MSVYAIGDLHLSLSPDVDKPMDEFGYRWFNHTERLEENWRRIITEEDTVIIPGDISWGLKFEEAKYDLDWLENLPGKKAVFKGNHDLWWNGITKLNKIYDSITFVQNDFYLAEDFVVCGTRGWITPDNDEFSEGDEKIYKREIMRLESSLSRGKAYIEKSGEDLELLGILHYPPVAKASSFSGFQQVFDDFGVKRVLYGHVHGEDGFRTAYQGNYHGIEYRLVSLDYLNCKPVLVSRTKKEDGIRE